MRKTKPPIFLIFLSEGETPTIAPLFSGSLEQSIVKLGWTVTRFNCERDYIAVVPPNASLLSDPKALKPKRLKITSLLDLVAKAHKLRNQKKAKASSDISLEPT